MDTNETDPLRKLICQTADKLLDPYGQFVCEVVEGVAHTGEAALFVDICYYQDAVPVPAEVTLQLRSDLRTVLLANNETRFPYVGYRLERPKAA